MMYNNADRAGQPIFSLQRTGMAHKSERHAAILELISAHDVASQEALRQLLEERGVSVTQATLSRDLRELGVVRVPGDMGARYALPETVAGEAIPTLDFLLPQLFSRIDGVGELIVLHTLASGAQPVSEAIDAAAWKEVLGTIAGENTILVVCRSAQARQDVTVRLTQLARGKP
jgi:transcriptional regulator of arginine metabolism